VTDRTSAINHEQSTLQPKRWLDQNADALGRSALSFTAVLVSTLGIVLAIYVRIIGFYSGPALWIDETFTGAIAGQATFHNFIELAHADAPPSFLYYLLMHLWQMLFGLSDMALRAPSVIFSVVAPFVLVFTPIAGLTRIERLSWAALLGLWIPGIGFSQDARCYAMLLLFATIQTLTFQRLLLSPTFRQTALWVLSADLTMFGNYDAAYLGIAQGVIFLAVHRGKALRTWPSIFLVIPVFLEVAWKWPVLLRFEGADTAWYPILNARFLLQLFFYPIGGLSISSAAVWVLLLPLLSAGAFIAGRFMRSASLNDQPAALKWTAAASLIGAVAMITVGFFKPTFTWRYMPPFEPGLMLGLILIMRAIARDAKNAGYAGLVIIAATAYHMWSISGDQFWDSASTPLNIEQASEYLMKHEAETVVFAWDSPTARVMPPQLLSAVGGFFFRRDGMPVSVIPVKTVPSGDANVLLLEQAKSSNASIIWLYDLSIHGTSAINVPQLIEVINPNYVCQDFGDDVIGSVACYNAAK
jgi:hypothetical protein